ncbi:hypothetical protein BJX76DRAFT_357513 [Aspergillus varians]
MGNHPSEIITRVAYQVLNIHLLFPQGQSIDTNISQPMDYSLIPNTIHALATFIDSLRCVEQSLTPPDILNGVSPCSSGGIILRQLELADLAQRLYLVCKHPLLRDHIRTRDVKLQLKMVKHRFETLADPLELSNLVDIPVDPFSFGEAAFYFEPLNPDASALLDMRSLDFLSSDMVTPRLFGN